MVGAGLDKDNAADAPRLFIHEQYHVRLACALAAAATAALPPEASKTDAATAHAKLQEDLDRKIDQYDTDTSGGCDGKRQKAWQDKIDTGKL